jgi:hypothetical protein
MLLALLIPDQANPQIIGSSLESLIRPYVSYLTFGIDIAAGIIIGLSALAALISFFKIFVNHQNSKLKIKRLLGYDWQGECY